MKNEVMAFWDICSGISWTICKQSAPRSRQITTPTTQFFTGGMFFLTPKPNQQCQNTEGKSDLLTCYMPMVSRRELLLQRKNCSGVKQNSSYQLTKIVISESVHRPTSSTATSEKTKEPNQ